VKKFESVVTVSLDSLDSARQALVRPGWRARARVGGIAETADGGDVERYRIPNFTTVDSLLTHTSWDSPRNMGYSGVCVLREQYCTALSTWEI
jgi:hypothetical protein